MSFDPASMRNLGWSVIENDIYNAEQLVSIDCGTHVMAVVSEPWMCLWPLFQFVDGLIEKTNPDIIVLEKTSAFAGGFVTGQVSNCIGAILSACGKHNKTVKFVYPTHVKKVVTGKGKATKAVMKKAVKALIERVYGQEVKFSSEHDCDACANVFCWLIDEQLIEGNQINE